mmetsp:Transcript_11819/g.24417  ORF Transcript_11819/g.24417 Transcript_11819/m.24417 type:complete len:234 (-) Transcript_11819:235-936(-)|eukprot:CAMPEP_0197261762 /NCGR_PEP_ID=MMETSP1432-20130617/134_1 /TAXON_ID=44447 /ORGANISM="Pseudo-nitzschia delicatissima, Strain UNC1205" /LENGTH=233 /DNA_ID=CAMNT_0042726047 /DNA_START=60 /DNA_END=761 /DNA_ORIENTATION=+
MIFKSLVFLGLLSSNVSASLRGVEQESEVQLDLEVIVEGGERQLFPLLPGTKCPTGHHCRVRTTSGGMNPMMGSLKDNLKTPLAATLDWQELNNNLNTVVASNNYCSRRSAMARAAGLAAGVSLATVSKPAYAAETKAVKMGSDSGQLVFVPAKITICSGDMVEWTNNKGGPHNVVFDEEAIPSGVDQEKISMDEQLGEEGDTFSMKFSTTGTYEYYCEPHRGAGMNGVLVVQ